MNGFAGHKRSYDELLQAFNEQRHFLRSSTQAYDNGNISEAKRIATSLYVLLHDGRGRTVSLLSQLQLTKTPFLSSSNYVEREGKSIVFPTIYLAAFTCINENEFELLPHCYRRAFIDNPYCRSISFREWWNEPIFAQYKYVPAKDRWKPIRKLSRMNLISHVRSQDGGAHFDASIEPGSYMRLALRQEIGIAWQTEDGQTIPIHTAPHLVLLRQVAWEVEESLRDIPGGPSVPVISEFPPMAHRSR